MDNSHATVFHTEGTGSSGTIDCLNLRPDSSGDAALGIVGLPDIAAPENHRPLLGFTTAGSEHMLLTVKDNELFIYGENGTGRSIGSPASEVLCAAHTGGHLLIMTQKGLYTAEGPDYATLNPEQAEDYPHIGLRAAYGGLLRTDVGARTLTGNYRRESTLSAADSRAVSADIKGAYATLCDEARTKGVMMQPALARYTLLDADGAELYTSAPVLLGQAQCAQGIRLTCNADALLEGYTLTAHTWVPVVDIPAVYAGRVSAVRISMTPQLQPVEPDADPQIWLSHPLDASAAVTVRLKISNWAIGGLDTAATQRIVAAAAARMDMLERVVATISAEAGIHTIPCSASMQPSEELAAMRKAMRTTVPEAAASALATAAPHCFSARCAAVAGDIVAWGDITPRRFAGYPAEAMAASREGSGKWEAYVCVDMADGSRVVRRSEGENAAPTSFGPLCCYPSPDAVRMRIGVRSEAGSVGADFQLTPAEGRHMAVYIHPSGRAFAPETAAFEPPEEIQVERAMPDCVVAATASAPAVAIASRGGFGERVMRLLPAPGSTSSWDFGRSRFYAFAAGGIYTAALNSARDTIASGRIDSRGIAAPETVAEGADGDIYAVGGGDLLRVGARTVSTVIKACGYTMLAWDGTHSELWCMGPRVGADVLCMDTKPLRGYRRDIARIASVACDAGGAFAATDAGVIALHRQSAARMRVAWRVRIAPANGWRRRISRVSLHAAAANADLLIETSAAGMQLCEPSPSVALRVRGQIRSPLDIRLPLRPVRYIEINVEGSAAPGFMLSRVDVS